MAVALRLSKPPSPLPSHHLTPSLLCYSQLFSSLQRRIASPLRCRCSKKKETSFTDQLLDYIEGGPKLRKWYGAPDLLPKDGGLENEDESSEIEEVRDAVLVTDGESEIGQMIILSLILKRARIKALVKDKRAALDAFGTYVETMVGDLNDKTFLTNALRGVRAIICASNDGFFSDKGRTKGAQHIVLLSQLAFYRGSSGIQAVMNSKARKLAERDEETVIASGIPYTIIRAGLLQDSPGGKQGFSFSEGAAAKGRLSKGDAAAICVEALDSLQEEGLIFEVVNGEEKVRDWKEKFAELIGTAEERKRHCSHGRPVNPCRHHSYIRKPSASHFTMEIDSRSGIFHWIQRAIPVVGGPTRSGDQRSREEHRLSGCHLPQRIISCLIVPPSPFRPRRLSKELLL
ncbi:hypothetical protein OPV22_022977 [Ensete ventricosum]|uniref:NAD(P)-binding domain-containing protein n=1 Tax=Ensete ventricosum TaxID=4639 RepID=A0AAV8QMG5_ENSVE|nr:hypothetical protein OPV22_022977 [Ensete ventricosum]